MKKIVALFLSLLLVFCMSACNLGQGIYDTSAMTDPPQDPTQEPTPDLPTEEFTEPGTVPDGEPGTEEPPSAPTISCKKYYETQRYGSGNVHYKIFDLTGNVLVDQTQKDVDLGMEGEYVVTVRAKNSKGVSYRFYNVLSGSVSKEFFNVKVKTDSYVLYPKGDFNSTLVIESIFDDSFYREYKLDFAQKEVSVVDCWGDKNCWYLCYEKKEGKRYTLLSLSESEPGWFDDYTCILWLLEGMYSSISAGAPPMDCGEVYGITDPQEAEYFQKLYSSIAAIYNYRKGYPDNYLGYDIKDLNQDGVFELILLFGHYEIAAIFTTVEGKPVLLDHFSDQRLCVLDHKGLLGVIEEDEKSYDIQYYRIAGDGASLEWVDQFGWYWPEQAEGTAAKHFYQMVNGEKISITEEEYVEITVRYTWAHPNSTQYCARLDVRSLQDSGCADHACAKQAFLAVLEGRASVFDIESGEFKKLADCRIPWNSLPLSEAEGLEYALLDLDGDWRRELAITCDGGALILRYGYGTVYLYFLANVEEFHADGSYAWSQNDGQGRARGESYLRFFGETLKEQEIWRTVNDGEANAEYYVGGRQVTGVELEGFLEDRVQDTAKTSSMSLPWEVNFSVQEALQIARQFWRMEDGWQEGATGKTLTYWVVLLNTPTDDFRYYHIIVLCESNYRFNPEPFGNSVYYVHHSAHILVDAMTGECVPYEPYSGK